jgi:hypothetical protein
VSFCKLNIETILKGAVLAIAHRLFPDGIPASVNAYANSVGVAPSTFTRAADWLLGLLPKLFKDRRPGPASEPAPQVEEKEDPRRQAVKKLDDLRKWLKERSNTPQNRCYDGQAKKRIAEVAEAIRAGKILTYGEIAGELGMDPRQLNRIREDVAACANGVPEKKNTRPKTSPNRTEPQIQILIARIESSADTRNPYGATDIKRILEKYYKKTLKKYQGTTTITEDTVAKYMGKSPMEIGAQEHPRGSYTYPEPFQVAALDTSYFKLFGFTFYIITVFDLGGRLNLLTRVFLRENTEAVVSVIEEFLSRYPAIEVAVIDRGSPYLNDEVKALIESHGLFRLVCPPETPTAKAPIERHFFTLKSCLRQAVEDVFSSHPGWRPEQMAKVLEVGVSIFARLYHLIPQKYIDGKCPAERAQDFDPVRAAARKAALFEQALNNEPSDQYARHFHRFFQFPWEEKKTVGKLRQFSTKALRQLLEQEKKNLGPPFPETIIEPLGYLAARAREIQNKMYAAIFSEKWREEDAKKEKKDHAKELSQDDANPEARIDEMLQTLVLSVQNNHGVSQTIGFFRHLLSGLKKKMGSFFVHEVSRLKSQIAIRCADRQLQERIIARINALVADIMEEKSP